MHQWQLLLLMILLSGIEAGVSPSWIRDQQIDAGELKAVNFEPYLKKNTNFTQFLNAGVTYNGNHHFNKTNFTNTPRVIVGLKSYGMYLTVSPLSLNAGFKFRINSMNRTNFTYSVTAYSVTIASVHYQYFAVFGYNDLYYMQFYTITLNSSHSVFNGSISGMRTDSFTYSNPGGMVTGSNFTSDEMILQTWPYYFLFTPTGSALSFNATVTPASTSTFTVTLTANNGCSLSQIGLSVLYLNKTKIYEASYTQIFDISIYILTGSGFNLATVFNTTMDNFAVQYQFRNSEEGIEGVYLPLNNLNNVTYFYFENTTSAASKLYYKAIQQRYRYCPPPTLYYLVDDKTCYNSCPTPRYATNTSFYYCKQCHYSCYLCSSADTPSACTQCNTSAIRTFTNNNSCPCNLTYYDVSVELCAPCHYTCRTCNNNNDTACISCDGTGLRRTLKNGSCTCLTGFYENVTCMACLNYCLECSYTVVGSIYRCLSCNATLLFETSLDSTACVCMNGYYFNNSGLCSACILGCLTCSDGNTCLTCDSSQKWEKDTNDSTCICTNGYFLGNSSICSTCISGCLACSNGTTCLTCDSAQKWQKNTTDSTCICIDGYYLLNKTCVPCQAACLSCLMNDTILKCLLCDTAGHFLLSNNTCTCETRYYLSSSSCLLNASALVCGNGIVDPGEQCDDGNTDNKDGCSSVCKVQSNHLCLNNITIASICYYSGQISLSNQQIFKVPLQNRVLVTLLVFAPNCNPTLLEKYLQNSVFIVLVSKGRLLASPDISSQTVQYDLDSGIAKIDLQYKSDIDLSKKQVKLIASLDYKQAENRYFYASPQTTVSLSAPDNLLLTTYASSQDINTAKTISIVFAVMIGLMWFFWLVSICYHQTASAVQFMIITQIAYEALLQRRFITDGWIGLVLYGKYCYGYNVEYPAPVIFDRLRVLSLDPYLFHTINISVGILLFTVIAFLAVFCYETVMVRVQENNGELNVTEAKIQTSVKSTEQRKDVQSQYKLKKGVILAFFQVAISFSLLTVKIVVISLMMVSSATAIDTSIVSTIMLVCYFLTWYFTYKFYDFQFLDDLSFKRILRSLEDTSNSISLSAKIDNIFVKYYYLCIFVLLALFGVVDGLPSFGAPFYITVIAACFGFMVALLVYGVYFRMAHAVRAGFNLLALVGVMVLHLMESLKVDRPSQSLAGPIICLSTLFTALAVNFGLMAYIQIRRFSSRKSKYVKNKAKIAPIGNTIEINYTQQPHFIRQESRREPIEQGQENAEQLQQVRGNDKSGESLARQSKIQSLDSKSRQNSFSETHKKIPVPRSNPDLQTKQKEHFHDFEDFVVIHQPVQDQHMQESQYGERSLAERMEIVDLSRSASASEFAKTKPKFTQQHQEQNQPHPSQHQNSPAKTTLD